MLWIAIGVRGWVGARALQHVGGRLLHEGSMAFFHLTGSGSWGGVTPSSRSPLGWVARNRAICIRISFSILPRSGVGKSCQW